MTTSRPGPPSVVAEPDELEDEAEEDAEAEAGAEVRTAAAPALPAPTANAGPRVARPAQPAPVSRTTPAPVGPRRAGRLDAAATRRPRPGRTASTAAAFEPLDPGDAAIPFDRVPYVPSDLRRVAVMAGVMVVLIIIAAIVVTKVVQ
jgi:hypothetical protein